MKLCEFKWMEFSEQATVVCCKGAYLAERMQDDCLVALYQVSGFYVEVYYRLRGAEIIKIISFHSTVLLEPYLQKIQVDSLLNFFPSTVGQFR